MGGGLFKNVKNATFFEARFPYFAGFVQYNLHRACQGYMETGAPPAGKSRSIQLAPSDHLDFNLDEVKQFAEAVRLLL